jgi:hypothetical protein
MHWRDGNSFRFRGMRACAPDCSLVVVYHFQISRDRERELEMPNYGSPNF